MAALNLDMQRPPHPYRQPPPVHHRSLLVPTLGEALTTIEADAAAKLERLKQAHASAVDDLESVHSKARESHREALARLTDDHASALAARDERAKQIVVEREAELGRVRRDAEAALEAVQRKHERRLLTSTVNKMLRQRLYAGWNKLVDAYRTARLTAGLESQSSSHEQTLAAERAQAKALLEDRERELEKVREEAERKLKSLEEEQSKSLSSQTEEAEAALTALRAEMAQIRRAKEAQLITGTVNRILRQRVTAGWNKWAEHVKHHRSSAQLASHRDELEEQRLAHEAAMATAAETLAQLQSSHTAALEAHAAELADLRRASAAHQGAAVESTEAEAAKKLERMKQAHTQSVEDLESTHAQARESHRAALARLGDDHAAALEQQRRSAEERAEALRRSADERAESITREMEAELDRVKRESEVALGRLRDSRASQLVASTMSRLMRQQLYAGWRKWAEWYHHHRASSVVLAHEQTLEAQRLEHQQALKGESKKLAEVENAMRARIGEGCVCERLPGGCAGGTT